MEVVAFRAFSVFLLLSIGGIRLTLTARYSLQNVTKWVGREAIIICDAETNNNANQLFWNKYDPQQTNIYNPNNPNAIDSNKYSTGNGNNTLTVKNVKLEDAATYCCAYNPGDDYCANLVVIDSLKVSVDPSDGVQAGEAVNITCVLSYDSPLKDVNSPLPLSEDQDLHLSLFIGDQKIEKGGDGIEVVGSATHYHSKTLSFNRTIQKSDAGKQLSCKVFSQNPQIDNYTNGDLNVFVETQNADIIYPNNGVKSENDNYLVDSVFICTGDGNPQPYVAWLEGSTNTSMPNDASRGNDTWQPPKPGTYQMTCSARDYKSRKMVYDYMTVIAVNSPANVSESKQNTVGLGVGIGVGIGVPVVIGVILLIVFLSRRKKTSQPYPVKQPEKQSKSPSTGKAPNGKNNDPAPGPRNNVNPNPNPTYTTPVMPEQTGNSAPRNVRDSPGYGDLGVRQIGGSGSNPHLNESFDSKANASFDSSRNYPPDGNFVVKPGRTSNSPSVPNTSV